MSANIFGIRTDFFIFCVLHVFMQFSSIVFKVISIFVIFFIYLHSYFTIFISCGLLFRLQIFISSPFTTGKMIFYPTLSDQLDNFEIYIPEVVSALKPECILEAT